MSSPNWSSRYRTRPPYALNLLDWDGSSRRPLMDWSESPLLRNDLVEGAGDDESVSGRWAARGYSDTDSDTTMASDVTAFGMDDEEDWAAFRGVTAGDYREIRKLKHIGLSNKKTAVRVRFSPSRWSTGMLQKVGVLLSRGRELRNAYIGIAKQDGCDYQQMISLIFGGPFQDHSLKRFWFQGFGGMVFQEENMRQICRYLGSSTYLRSVKLSQLQLDRDALNVLSSAQLELDSLFFHEIDADDDALCMFLTSLNTKRLKRLSLSNCKVGRNVCRALANGFLSRPDDDDSFPSELSLANTPGSSATINVLDDNCVEILCESLRSNTYLTSLDLSNRTMITNDGWRLFQKLLFDSTSLDSISLSNHTLGKVIGRPESNEAALNDLLRINTTEHPWYNPPGPSELLLRARLKIAKHLCRGDKFDTTPFDDFDAMLMPHVLAFLGEKRPTVSDEFDGAFFTMDALFTVIRAWDMPTLFTFPSREKIQFTAEINQLKRENDRLRRMNENMTSESKRLQTEIHSPCEGNAKRARSAR